MRRAFQAEGKANTQSLTREQLGAHEEQQVWGERGKKCQVRPDRWMRKEPGGPGGL